MIDARKPIARACDRWGRDAWMDRGDAAARLRALRNAGRVRICTLAASHDSSCRVYLVADGSTIGTRTYPRTTSR